MNGAGSTGRGAPSANAFKQLRILALLLILLFVGLTSWQDKSRTRSWKTPLYVAIYPIVADKSASTRQYVARLDARAFEPIDAFFAREASRYGMAIAEPVRTRLKPELQTLPPQRSADDGALATMLWSLKLRFWAWRETRATPESADIRIFVLYHDPELSPRVPHSLGLEKGLIGVVYAFATPRMDASNDLVIAHELMHTLGATDKYDPNDDSPYFPQGYAEPQRVPLFPQPAAELMAGRRALDAHHSEQVDGLDEALIGPLSALEIRWSGHAH